MTNVRSRATDFAFLNFRSRGKLELQKCRANDRKSNGMVIGSFSDGSAADLTLNTAVSFVDDIATRQSEASAGSVRCIRTYNSALSASQVASLSAPLAPVPEPTSDAILPAGLGLVGAAVKRRKLDPA
jgi:hypothetical protein